MLGEPLSSQVMKPENTVTVPCDNVEQSIKRLTLDPRVATRVRTALALNNITTISQLAQLDGRELLKFKNFGAMCLTAVRDALALAIEGAMPDGVNAYFVDWMPIVKPSGEPQRCPAANSPASDDDERKCSWCHRTAVCAGTMGDGSAIRACDSCCTHGNVARMCSPLAEPQPCPSCGGPPADEHDANDVVHQLFKRLSAGTLWQCKCECGLSAPVCKSRVGAIAQWNMLWMTSAGDLAARGHQ